ncbi:MAG: NHLP leader peptide family RiPP precursor [Rubrobacteraceae bacterium]
MTEASGGSPEEMRQRLVQRSMEDEELRQRLLDDPKATVEQELGTSLPEGVEIQTVEETQDTVYLVLPPKPQSASGGSELSEQELESVAGGWDYTASTCFGIDHTCGQNTCGACYTNQCS